MTKEFELDTTPAQNAAWREAQEYVETGDMESLEKQVKNETRLMTELAYDVAQEQKKNKRLKIFAVIGGAIVAGVTGYICHNLGMGKSYKEIIGACEDGAEFISVTDKRTRRIYEIRTECIGD